MSSSQGLDQRLVLCPSLQEYFVDKDTGAPLSGGVVTFYSQDSQTFLKPVYTLSGNGPFSDASYIPLPNPMILSAAGTFVDDNGNDIVPYLFPYDGTPTNSNNNVELYYITVYSSSGVLQFTREAWPNTTATTTNVNEIVNFIPNGQFLLHNSNPVKLINVPVAANGGATNGDVSQIAQGGWTFQVPTDTTSVNTISYITNADFSDPDVTSNPRYLINIACTTVLNTDTFKDLCITFPDVNKFGTNNPSTSPNFTFSFQGLSNNGIPLPVQIRLLKYFGSIGGGVTPSSPTDTAFGVGTVTISPNLNNIYNISGIFGTNAGSQVGVNGDDYVQIVIRFPVSSLFNVTLSDFILTNGNVVLTGFPATTNAEMLAPSTAGFLPTPNPDGSDLYLPIKLGTEGFIFDTSEIGNIVAKTNISTFTGSISNVSNELLCDGSQYSYTGYSSIGIPYYRLANSIFDSTSGLYRWGSGSNWVNTYISTGSTTQLIIVTNKIGSQTVPADSIGATATGFTFNLNGNLGVSSNYGYNAYSNNSGIITAISSFSSGTNSGNGVAAGTSGMNVSSITNPASTIGYYAFQVTALAASALATGGTAKYFTFSNSSTNYYVWFFISTETDPAPGGTPIKCQLTSTMSAADVASVIAAVLSGYQENPITITGQPSGGAGSYWTFYSNTTQTAVWYQINGSGTAPAIASTIKVSINSTDTAAQVASKTQNAINKAFFATPNFQNMFLRGTGTAANSIWGDLDQTTRFALDSMLVSNGIGTFEIGQIVNHNHPFTPASSAYYSSGNPAGVNPGTSGTPFVLYTSSTGGTVGYTGGSETRPTNAYVTWAIKY